MMCEVGRTMWSPQMTCNLRIHCRKMSSEGVMVSRALRASFVTKKDLESGRTHVIKKIYQPDQFLSFES